MFALRFKHGVPAPVEPLLYTSVGFAQFAYMILFPATL